MLVINLPNVPKFINLVTHLQVFVEEPQFCKRLEPVVLLPAGDDFLRGCAGAVAENQIFHPPVSKIGSLGADKR